MNIHLRKTTAFVAYVAFVSVHVVGCGLPPSSGAPVQAVHRRDPMPPFVLPTPLAPPTATGTTAVLAGSDLADVSTAFTVTPQGAATWSHALQLLPGRNGMAPSLAISYSSQAGSGALGRGFSLQGPGSITRCWPVRAQGTDHQVDPAKIGVSSEFCLNGARLVQRQGEPAGRFSPEHDPSTLVRMGGTNANPAPFYVYRQNGVIEGYGARSYSNAQRKGKARTITAPRLPQNGSFTTDDVSDVEDAYATVVELMQDVTRDRYGNEIFYDYTALTDASGNNVELLLSDVKWTANPGFNIAPQRRAHLTWGKDKADPNFGFRMGVPVQSTKLLTGVEVYGPSGLTTDATHQETLQWNYQFEYDTTQTQVLASSVLKTMRRCFPSGGCTTPVNFEWQGVASNTPSFTLQQPPDTVADWGYDWAAREPVVNSVYDLTVADYDNDGFDDVVYRVPRVSQTDLGNWVPERCSFSQAISSEWRMRRGGVSGLGPAQFPQGLPEICGTSSKFGPRSVDLDNDGKTELLIYSEVVGDVTAPDGGTVRGLHAGYGVFTLSGNDFALINREIINPYYLTTGEARRAAPMTLGDFDGDGVMDMVRDRPPAGSAAWGATGPDFLDMRLANQRSTTLSDFQPGIFQASHELTLLDSLGLTHQMFVFDFGERLAVDLDGNGRTEIIHDVDRQECFPARRSNRHHDHFPNFTHYTLSTATRIAGSSFKVEENALPAGPVEQSQLAARAFGVCEARLRSNQPANPLPNPIACAVDYDTNSRTPFSRLSGDFNGDGLRDVLSFPATFIGGCDCNDPDDCSIRNFATSVFLNTNRGNNFAPATILPNPWTVSGTTSALPSVIRTAPESLAAGRPIDNGLRVVDLDGDGRDDIVQVASQGHFREPMRLFRSLPGNGFSDEQLNVEFARTYLGIGDEGSMNPYAIEGHGHGPRMTQFGDVNGDGLQDIVTLENQVTAYVQDTQTPLLLTRVSSLAVAGETIEYGLGRGVVSQRVTDPRPSSGRTRAEHTALYSISNTCTAPQRCVKNIGWVVASQTLPTGAVVHHTYADAVFDLNGRGSLGPSEHRAVVDQLEMFESFDHSSLLGAVGSADGYIYRQPYMPHWRIVRGATLTETEFTTNGTTSVSITSDWDMNTWDVLRSTREVVERDAHRTPIRTTTTTSNKLLPGHANSSVDNDTNSGAWEQLEVLRQGPDADCETVADCGGGEGWLIGRYPEVRRTYRTHAGDQDGIVWTLGYEQYRPDVERSEKRRDGYGSPNSGYDKTVVFTRDNLGNVTKVEASIGGPGSNSSPSVRTTTTSFAANDTERVFTHRFTNALDMPSFVHRLAATGLPVATDDVAARRVSLTWDEAGRPVMAIEPTGPVLNLGYASSAQGLTHSVTRGFFNQVTQVNRLGQRVSVSEPGISRVLYGYDTLGRLEKASLPLASSVNDASALYVINERDADGRVIAVTRPGESATAPRLRRETEYAGNVVTQINERGVREQTELDALGRPTAVTTFGAPEDVVTRYEYSRWGKVSKIIQPRSEGRQTLAETTISYDAFGRRLTLVDPDSGTQRFEYNAFDEVYSATDGNGAVTTYERDVLGRLLLEETPITTEYGALDSSSPYARRNVFEYDSAPNGLGQLARATSMATPGVNAYLGEVTNTYEYDALGRTTAQHWDGIGSRRSFGYGYDPVSGELQSIHYPKFNGPSRDVSVVAEFVRRNDGTVSGVDSLVDGAREQVWRATEFNAGGQVLEETFGSAIVGIRRYDASYALRFKEVRAMQGGGDAFQRLSYTWGEDGLLSRRTDLDLWSEEQFEHDAFDRLTKWTVRQNCIANEWRYDYDPSGNMLTRGLHPNGGAATRSTTFTYDKNAPHRATHADIEGNRYYLTYLPGGQVEQTMGNHYKWTPFGLPLTIQAGTQDDVAFHYDAFGARTLAVNAAGVSTVTLGGLYELRSTLQGQEATYTLPGRDGAVGQVHLSQSFSASNYASSTRYLHLDHLGNPDSVTTVSNGVASLVERGKYDPFGERRTAWALATPIAQMPSQTAYGFTGHSPDLGAGITNMKGRVYDQRLARFLSPDPLAWPAGQGLNRYSYVRNSPAMLMDPSGYDPKPGHVEFSDAEVDVFEPPLSSPPLVEAQPRKPLVANGQLESRANGAGPDETRQVDVLGVKVIYPTVDGLLSQMRDYLLLRDRRAMATQDAAEDAKPFGSSLAKGPMLLVEFDERSTWEMAKVAKDRTIAGANADSRLSAAGHFTVATLAMVLVAATLVPGEGAVAEGSSRLLGANRAIIDVRKLTEYALNPSHPVGGNKAKVFKQIGFTLENAADLLEQIRKGVMEVTPIAGKVDQFGARFTLDIPVVSAAGGGVVRTGWIFKPGSMTPELTTLFVK